MGPAKAWAAVWSSEPPVPCPSPHPAAALARRGDLLLCSCVLPWRGARPYWPDDGPDTASITIAALTRLRPALVSTRWPVIWGGDWNHAMGGPERAGTTAGREAILRLVAETGLRVATADAPHATVGLRSIDHIAIPGGWRLDGCERLIAEAEGRRLSDHDAYVVETVPDELPGPG